MKLEALSRWGLVGVCLSLGAVSSGCQKKETEQTPAPAATADSNKPKAVETTPAPAEPKAQPVVTFKNVGLATPESVLYDDVEDAYVVSNIQGHPLDADGKAFLSRLSPDGTVKALKWIEGGKNKVTLNAPKGMAFHGEHLLVADIDHVRAFDRKTGAPAFDIKIDKATFLNDVAVLKDGRVLVSDTGLKKGDDNFEAAGTDAVYAIEIGKTAAGPHKVTPLVQSKGLGAPNGIAEVDGKVWVVTFKSGELFPIDEHGKRGEAIKAPKGSLDGIVALGDQVLVSSWDGNAVYRGKPDGELAVVVDGVKAPADIGYDTKRGLLLVPLFLDNEVRGYAIK